MPATIHAVLAAGRKGHGLTGSAQGNILGSLVLSARHAILLLVAFAPASWLQACAQDEGLGDSPSSGGGSGDAGLGGSGGGGTAGDGGWPSGSFGAACTDNSQCDNKQCTNIGQNKNNKVCTVPCGTGKSCPSNGYCAWHPDKGYTCIPDTGNQCAKCGTSAECPNVGDTCTPSPKIDRFCARDCSYDGLCPSGFTCVAVDGYPPGLPGSDAGAPDGGLGEAGAPSKPSRMCVPNNGESCPCTAQRDGVKRRCTQQSGSLVCEGTETCNGAKGVWECCTAGAPQPEVCDGVDNDCNGTADDGALATLCPGTIAHATWACELGQCVIGACDPGWSHYPPSLPQSSGCPCAVDAKEPNDSCATATASGSVTDANTTALLLKGRLSSESDEDWYSFDAVDFDEGTTNSYHVRIVFTAPTNNGEFVFDVIRGDQCKTIDANHSNLVEYDWCVDGQSTVGGKPIGQKPCSATGPIHCGPHTKKYFVRVHRKAGATGSCAEYTLSVTAKGGPACDFSKACDPQVNEN
jgi:hypothetical protein